MSTSAVTGKPLVPASSWLKNLTAFSSQCKDVQMRGMKMANRDFSVEFIALEVEGGYSKAVGAMCLSITLHPVAHR